MAFHYNPRIMRNNLTLHLDAANPKSYSGSGTAWNDLSGEGNNYTMYGTVPYLSDNNGCWDFTSLEAGTAGSSPLGFTASYGMPFSTTESFTIMSWIYQTTDAGQTGLFSNAGGADGVRFGPAGGGIYYLISGTADANKEGVLGNGTFSLNEWVHICVVYDRQDDLGTGNESVYGYINGEFVESATLPSPQTAIGSASTPGIVRSNCCQRFIGKLATMSVYSKALGSTEVKENFRALRGRFGL